MAMAAVLLFLLLSLPSFSLSLSDADALLLLKSSFHNSDPALSSWFTGSPNATSPCSEPKWTGLLCFNGIVTGLRLGHLALTGTVNIRALSHFPALRTLSFVNNSLSGPLPDFSRLDALKSLYISHNRFSGPIPADLFAPMDHLKKLWINGNNFSGPIPASLSKAKSLLELHMEGNGFYGEIPDLKLPSLRSFNVSDNELSGPIPISLARFGASAFQANEKLCGMPMSGAACPEDKKVSSPEMNRVAGNGGKLVAMLMAMFIVLFLLVIGFAAFKRQNKVNDLNSVGGEALSGMEKGGSPAAAAMVFASPGRSKRGNGSSGRKRYVASKETGDVGGGGGSGGVLVMVNNERGEFGLPDLMKSAAEVLGNGGLGSVYKAMMSGGIAVAVKRMRDLSRLNREDFDGEIRRFGRLNHPNVLSSLAYHYRKEEKLIVSDYIAKGSLLYILHGDRGADRAALDWPTRMKIILGIARGMAYLHSELVSYEVPHGNLKSANVLLSPSFDPLLVDYGLITLVNPSVAPSALFSFKSPESQHLRQVSPKSDVFCFGILLLEILTGKFPSHYLNNTKGGTDVVHWTASAIAEGREAELIDPAITTNTAPTAEMLRLLQVGAACTQMSPDERPDMKEAAEFVEEIAVVVEALRSHREEVMEDGGI